MIVEIEKSKSLLQNVNRIAVHNEEIKKLRGESFNIFSILKMESRENETHSAFLGELLNPLGSHLLGPIFLNHFFNIIGCKGIDANTARLALEKPIGARDDESKTGGRVDIYIADAKGISICIENKIYASDQHAQIERYCNHNARKNTVYYLTREGDDATLASKGKLKEGRDYFCISYKNHILNWLGMCLKESAEQPILRESIKQYIIIIKKITRQLTDSVMEKDIHKLILDNFTSARLIASNFSVVELNVVHNFLLKVKVRIERNLKEDWIITVDENLRNSWSGIEVTREAWNGITVRLQGEPKIIGGRSIYGVVAPNQIWDRNEVNNRLSSSKLFQQEFNNTAYWPYYKSIDLFIKDEDILRLLDNTKSDELVEETAEKIMAVARECEVPLSGIKKLNE
ncbi:MAG TPA: PD-(D/E)XK nuclease family protein [Chryseolinea sp.]